MDVRKYFQDMKDGVLENSTQCGNVHNSGSNQVKVFHKDFSRIVHNSQLDQWRERLLENSDWMDREPFRLDDDPLWECPIGIRQALVREWLDRPKEPPLVDRGMPRDEWNRLYVTEWYKIIEGREPELFRTQAEVVLLFADRPITLRKGLQIGSGPIWKRGAKGHTIDDRGLRYLPEEYAELFQAQITQHSAILCHIEGTLCTLPESWIRFKKVKR